jgi:hypothetical protein
LQGPEVSGVDYAVQIFGTVDQDPYPQASVESDCRDEDEACRDRLPERRDTEQVEAVCDHPEQEDADDRAG